VEALLGDASKARNKLGWTPRTSFQQLIREMIQGDYASASRDSLVRSAGFQTYDFNE
jgi:GDPmannose 4,6-dehydratase